MHYRKRLARNNREVLLHIPGFKREDINYEIIFLREARVMLRKAHRRRRVSVLSTKLERPAETASPTKRRGAVRIRALPTVDGNSIPDFASRITPLRNILKEAHLKSGSRTKRSVHGIPLVSLSWDKGHEQLFREFREEIHNMKTLSRRKIEMALCVYTAASNAYWAGVVMETNAD